MNFSQSIILFGFFILMAVYFKNKNIKKKLGNYPNLEMDFVKKNNFFGEKWSKKQKENIIKKFNGNTYVLFENISILSEKIVFYSDGCLLIYNKKIGWNFIEKKDVLEIILEKNGERINLGNAIIGGVLFGTAGAIIGALNNKKIRIDILTKDNPQNEFTLFFDGEISNQISNYFLRLSKNSKSTF